MVRVLHSSPCLLLVSSLRDVITALLSLSAVITGIHPKENTRSFVQKCIEAYDNSGLCDEDLTEKAIRKAANRLRSVDSNSIVCCLWVIVY